MGSNPTPVASDPVGWNNDGSGLQWHAANYDLGGMGYNVRATKYGATGGGVVSDANAFSLAANDAHFAPAGGMVIVPPGTYLIDVALPNYSNVVYYVVGATFTGAQAATVAPAINFDKAGNLVAKSLTTLANGPYSSVLPGDATTATPAGVQTGTVWDWGGEVYNLRAGGVKGDGTDEAAKIQAVFNQAGAALVVAPKPPVAYGVGTALIIPSLLSLIGPSSGFAEFRALAAIDIFSIDSAVAFGNRYGLIQGIYANGNNLANRDWNLGVAVERTFIACRGENAKAGWILRNTQNCVFIACEMENNTLDAVNGAGLRISWGAANNVFLRCECNQNGPYQIRFHALQTLDPVTSIAPGANFPAWNVWEGGVIERPVAGAIAMIDMRAGRGNRFVSMTMGLATVNAVLFQCNNTDDQVNLTTFDGVHLTGLAATTCFQLQNHIKLRLKAFTAETFATLISSDDNSTVEIDGDFHMGGVTTFFANFGAGVKRQDQIVRSEYFAAGQFDREVLYLKDVVRSNQTPAFVANFTPDQTAGEIIYQTLTGNITINVPANPQFGQKMTFQLTEDATGGRTVTWGAGFVLPGNAVQCLAPNATTMYEWVYTGAWRLTHYLILQGQPTVLGTQFPTFAATITPDPTLGEFIQVVLTGAITVNAPLNPQNGQKLTFQWAQDATGGRVVTYNPTFVTSGAAAFVTTANTVTTDVFIYSGAWRLISRITGQ